VPSGVERRRIGSRAVRCYGDDGSAIRSNNITKARYDPRGAFGDLYAKCVLRR